MACRWNARFVLPKVGRSYAGIRAQEMASEYEHLAVEVPPGSPQIKYSKAGYKWLPRGDVPRCLIDEVDGEAIIQIDDRELSIQEFGKLLTTYAGWGMRLVFVPEDEIADVPRIEVREPVDDNVQ